MDPSEELEEELEELRREIVRAKADLRARKDAARGELRRVRVLGNVAAAGMLAGLALVFVLLLVTFEFILHPRWYWLQEILAGVSLIALLYANRNNPVLSGLSGWLARMKRAEDACVTTLRDRGFDIHLMETSAGILEAKLGSRSGDEGREVMVDPGTLTPWPVRSELPEHLVQRIRRLEESLRHVDSRSLEDWLDGFSRDANPIPEIEWWEGLERTFRLFVQVSKVQDKEQRAAYRLVAKRALGASREDMATELRDLPADAYQLLQGCFSDRS